MTEPPFNVDGYPTEETLETIRTWDYKDREGWFGFIEGEIHQPIRIGEAIRSGIDRLEQRMSAPGLPGITTGFSSLNADFGGFEGGKLYYVGGRPSQGKTALLLNFALAAIDSGTPIGIISVESNARELADRLLAIRGRVNSLGMKFGRLKQVELVHLKEAVDYLYEKSGLIYYNPHATIADVVIQARRMVRNHGIKALFVDYVQLINAGRDFSRQPRYIQVGHCSRSLKGLASEINIPIIAAAQMRRDLDGRYPSIGDFADSSEIEKDADVAMAIYHTEIEFQPYSAIVTLKARDGVTGECPVVFTKEHLRFIEDTK